MNLLNDARVLTSLLRGIPRKGEHASRLNDFYRHQAGDYDRFRERLLSGRRELMQRLPLQSGDLVVELGGGTGRNVDFLGTRANLLQRYEVVDLCQPLLDIAKQRAARNPCVQAIEGDATTYRPGRPADVVVFSYALSMIPMWRDAINNAVAMLKPGGTLAVVDFYVSAASPPAGMARHGRFTRWFWPRWFGHDGVRLSSESLETVSACTDRFHLVEDLAKVPYVPSVRVPFYTYMGRKPQKV